MFYPSEEKEYIYTLVGPTERQSADSIVEALFCLKSAEFDHLEITPEEENPEIIVIQKEEVSEYLDAMYKDATQKCRALKHRIATDTIKLEKEDDWKLSPETYREILRKDQDTLLTAYCLISNYNFIFWHSIYPFIVNEINQYAGKQLGTRTKEKLWDKLAGIRDDIGATSIGLYTQYSQYVDMKISIGTDFGTITDERAEYKEIVNEANTIRFLPYYTMFQRSYILDTDEYIKRYHLLQNSVTEKKEELKKAEAELNENCYAITRLVK